MDPATALQQITASVKTATEGVESVVKNQKTIEARIGDLEQEVVRGNGGWLPTQSAQASIGALAMQQVEEGNQAGFENLKQWNAGTCRINLNAGIRAALTNDGAGGAGDSSVPRQPEQRGIFTSPGRPLRLLEALPSRPTTRDSVQFVQLGTTGEAAEQIKEGDEKAAVDFEGTPQTANIVTIAAHTTASRQVLSDHPALQAAIDMLIRRKLLDRLENQLVNGPGGEGRINGLRNQATIFTPTIGTTPADIIGESLTRQADRGYLPSLVLINPMDWFRLQITKKATGDEDYIFGSPTMPIPPALWNTMVVPTASMPEGEAMTIDTSFTTVLDREAPSVLLSNSHKDYFTRNLVLILGELRAGLEVLDTAAIYKMSLVGTP
ncbi:phage major capsid protein [Pseudomonas putida]|uniref:phage major capsid protein n=1 Tax=Pseudomonas putida TaxID=303 RepID=UPI0018AC20B0|nr:phage major capsid protein [Pseudomonas putida]MBF8766026.1 phage major capsid protein [Pseudomonas putida]